MALGSALSRRTPIGVAGVLALVGPLMAGATSASVRQAGAAGVARGVTTRVSVASDGSQGNRGSGRFGTAISADGRYVAFTSVAGNLAAGDTNGWPDVFVRDRLSGVTSRVSVASDGRQGNDGGDIFTSAISADGRYVAFDSYAGNLVAGDMNRKSDVFVRDRRSGVTSRVSVASDGRQGNGGSFGKAISADGRYVAFLSVAGNLVAGDTNGANDIFVRDRGSGVTSRVSVASDGRQGKLRSGRPAISADGRYVAFFSYAGNLVAGDTNGWPDVFVRDRLGAARF